MRIWQGISRTAKARVVEPDGLALSPEHGALSLPLVAILMTLTVAGLGIWGFLRDWRQQMETQLRLDECVGEAALSFRDSLDRIERFNRWILELRVALAASEIAPQTIVVLQTALQAAVLKQDAERLSWPPRQALWLARGGCGARGDTAQPLPSFRWVRPPPDLLGPRPLQWEGAMPPDFRVEAAHRRRKAAATIEGVAKSGTQRLAKWAPPFTSVPLGPGAP